MRRVAVAVLSLVVAGAACREVKGVVECPSPDGATIATFYVVAGGGAAGFQYGRVSLRPASSAFDPDEYVLQLQGGSDARLGWASSDSLVIEYPEGARLDSAVVTWGERPVGLRYVRRPALFGVLPSPDGPGCVRAG